MITGKAKLAGVMGWPIAHSKSPILHGYWLDKFGIDGAYVPLPIAPENLGEAVAGLKAMGFAGWNITVPHKEAILPYLDGFTPDAQAIGAVNTVIRQADGTYLGHNTDGFGFIENLKDGQPGFSAEGKTVLLIGAGGACRAVVHSLLVDGAAKIFIANRSLDKAQALADAMGPKCQAVGLDQTHALSAETDLLINATSLGMTGKPDLPLTFDLLPKEALVTDLVYTPLETPLLAWAKARGNPVVDGLGMLLHQARAGFEAWFDQPVEVTEDLRQIILNA